MSFDKYDKQKQYSRWGRHKLISRIADQVLEEIEKRRTTPGYPPRDPMYVERREGERRCYGSTR